ncbi:MAG: glycosyltransferase family 4 protein [Candidatus Electrothrix sp. GM3_4]|nr:glycosyltransferase family 4 protein [Candidatus Electrothrix sp. GM3_4]
MKSANAQGLLKVLLLTTSFPLARESRSGIFIQKMINHLPENTQVTVLTPDSIEKGSHPTGHYAVIPFRYAPKNWQQLAHGSGGIMAALSRNKLFFLLLPPFLCSNLLTCCWSARKMDTLRANWSINGVIAGIAGLLFGKPVMTTLRGSDVNLIEKSAVMRQLVHFCLRFSDAVVTVSPSLQEKLVEHFPEYSTKIRVICNGIDQVFFDAGKHTRNARNTKKDTVAAGEDISSEGGEAPIRFLYVGNLTSGKGVDVILKAAALLPPEMSAKKWSLDIIGDGPEREALEGYCREQHLETKVAFHGSVPPEEIPLLMAEADVFVFASFAEGRPNVVLEAMACGLPIIAGAIPAVSDLIEHGQQGLLFPPGDVSALSEHMLFLLSYSAERRQLGDGARDYLTSLGLSWPEAARVYASLYTEIAERAKGAGISA